MGIKEFILNCIDQNYRSLLRSLEGLSAEELAWQPNSQCNSIGFLVWHYARVLDGWIQSRVRGKPQLWEQGWAEKFDRPTGPRDVGFGLTAEEATAFSVPSPEVLVEYAAAAHGEVTKFLDGLDDDALINTKIRNSFGGEISLATLFQQLIWELNQHGGQIAYLRGIQRGLEDSSYTGGVLN